MAETIENLEFFDWSSGDFCARGMMVIDSDHIMRERRKKDEDRRIGIIVELKFYEFEDHDRVLPHPDTGYRPLVLCFPEVHWEGSSFSSTVHPANLTPWRVENEAKLKKCLMQIVRY